MAIITFSAEDLKDNVINFSAKPDKSESVVKKARIFYAGTHKGKTYTEKDLEDLVKNSDPSKTIPVQLDHSSSAKDTVGKGLKFEKVGNEIYADLEFKGKDNVEKINSGLWEKLSCGLKIDDDAMSIREISVTPFPALDDARILHNDGKEGGNENVKINADAKTDPAGKTEQHNADGEKIINFAEFSALKSEVVQMREEKAALEKKIQFAEDEKTIDNFVLEGRTTPAMRDKELALFNSLDEAGKQSFLDYKATQPTFVDFNVYNTASFSKPGEMSNSEAEAEAEKLLKFSGIPCETK